MPAIQSVRTRLSYSHVATIAFALIIVVAALPALWPFIRYGLPGTADGHLHLLRLVVLDHHVQQGMLYPRWTPELVLGYGYPVFNFYGPSSYYIALFLHNLGLSYVLALISTFGFFILAAGLGMYWLASDLYATQNSERRRWLALVAAVAYLYSPYLLTNVYMRGALAEAGAQALLPWVFWGFRRLLTAREPVHYLLPATLALGGLAITHTITLIFAPPILLLYLLIVWLTNPETKRARYRHLAWTICGGFMAIGSSAFFWLPLLIERTYLAGTAYEISERFIHENVWTWQNFLDLHWPFDYTLAIPFQIGFLQLLLAVIGFVLLRQRSAEWWYWFLLIPMLGVAMSQPLLPVWLTNDILLTAQFPWRLLTLMSLPLALLSAALLARIQQTSVVVGALILAGLFVVSHRPQLPPGTEQFPSHVDLGLPTVAQFELDTGAFGTGSASEYMPRWVKVLDTVVAPPIEPVPSGQTLELHDANDYQLDLSITNPAAEPLRLTRFYFPGWQATMNDKSTVPLDPTTLMGLLTAAIPEGTHSLQIRWQGTRLQWWAALWSLMTFLTMAILLWRQKQPLLLCGLPLVLTLFGSVAMFKPLPVSASFQQSKASLEIPGLRLLGYYTEQPSRNQIYLYPFWQVGEHPIDLILHWRLVNVEGEIASEIRTLPYFNTRHVTSWVPSSLAHDAYVLPLPAGLAAGKYTLQLGFEHFSTEEPVAVTEQRLTTVGQITIGAVPYQESRPSQPYATQWEGNIWLDGYDIRIDGKMLTPLEESSADPPMRGNEPMMQGSYLIARPGDQLSYTLYWRAETTPLENYHGFLHLLDHNQQALVQRDQLPGPIFSPPRLWNRFIPQTDSYVLTIPPDATSGLHTPHVGLYHFESGQRLVVMTADGTELGSSLALPPVKVVAATERAPQHPLAIRVGDFAELIGYDLTFPTPIVPDAEFTVTLFYRVTAATTIDYTQFVHLYDDALGMATQMDAMPNRGGNPTTAWVPGEVISDEITLQIEADAAPGRYTLQVGFYDAANGAARVPLSDERGQPVVNAQVQLVDIEVLPCTEQC